MYDAGSSIYITVPFRLSGDYDTDMVRWRRCKAAVSEAIIAHGDTISHQHGVGIDHRPYLAAGGGSQSNQVMQILVDVFNLPAERARTHETSALGAAINAAIGLGWYADHAAAAGSDGLRRSVSRRLLEAVPAAGAAAAHYWKCHGEQAVINCRARRHER